MKYSNDLDLVVNSALDELIHDYMSGDKVFSEKKNKAYLNTYLELCREQTK